MVVNESEALFPHTVALVINFVTSVKIKVQVKVKAREFI